jgi:hypothetical protein
MGGSWSSLLGSSSMQTREILDTIFKTMIERADLRDLYSLADPTACKEYIVMTEEALKKLFKRFRLSRAPGGELLIQSIKGIQSASNPEAGEQQKRCRELAFYFIRIFQIYAAIAISILDSKMPLSDPAPYRASNLGARQRQEKFIHPQEGIKGFGQAQGMSWPTFSWSGGSIKIDSPFYLTLNANYDVLNDYIPSGINYKYAGKFLPFQDTKKEFTSRFMFSYDSLYMPQSRKIDIQSGSEPAEKESFEKDNVTSLRVQFSKDTRTLTADVVFTKADPNGTKLTIAFATVILTDTIKGDNIQLQPLPQPIQAEYTADQIVRITDWDRRYQIAGTSFPVMFESYLDAILEDKLKPEFSITDFLVKYSIIYPPTGTGEQKAAAIQGGMSTDSRITFLKAQAGKKTDTIEVEYTTKVAVEKVRRNLTITLKMTVQPKNNTKFLVLLNMRGDQIRIEPEEMIGFVFPRPYESGFKERTFLVPQALGNRTLIDDKTNKSLQYYLDESFKKMLVTGEERPGVEYTRNGIPVPLNTERMPPSMRIKDLWNILAQRPSIKAYAVALGTTLINPGAMQGPVKTAYSDVCRTSFPYIANKTLPTVGQPVTSSHGIKALYTLFFDGLEAGIPKIKDNQKYQEFLGSFKQQFSHEQPKEGETLSIESIRRDAIQPCKGNETKRIRLEGNVIAQLQSHVHRLMAVQEAHVRNSMNILFQLFDEGSITKGNFNTSIYVQQEGMAAVNAIAARARDMLMNYYVECEKINRDALRDIHIYLGRTPEEFSKQGRARMIPEGET